MLNLTTYQLLTGLCQPLLAAGFLLRSFKQEAYRQRIGERFGHYRCSFSQEGVIIHGASVGEVIALQPFIERVLADYSDTPVTVTTFTPTGSAQVQKHFGTRVQHCYLPVDATTPVKRFLSILKPKILVLMETELWPTLIDCCHRQNIKVLLINARISQRSFPRYKKIQKIISPTLSKVDMFLAQSDEDQARLISLGATPEKVSVSGNIKYDLGVPNSADNTFTALKNSLEDRKTWVVGSTHEDEETLIIAAHQHLRKKFPDILIVLAPRHPERVEPIVSLLRNAKLSFLKRSENAVPQKDTDVLLIDTLGELVNFYQLADVCTIAGSFGKTGGHNPLEACLFAKPIVVGPNMENFQDITNQLVESRGIVKLGESSAELLSHSVSKMFSNPEDAAETGANAAQVLLQNRGAVDKTLATLQSLLH